MYNLFLQKHFQLLLKFLIKNSLGKVIHKRDSKSLKMRHKNVMQVIMNTHTWRKAQQRTDKLCAVTVSINIYT